MPGRADQHVLVEVFLHLSFHASQRAGAHPFPHMIEQRPVQSGPRVPQVDERRVVQRRADRLFPGVASLAAQEHAGDGQGLPCGARQRPGQSPGKVVAEAVDLGQEEIAVNARARTGRDLFFGGTS